MTRAVQATALAAVVGLFALLVWRLTHQAHPPKLGGPAPQFTAKRLDSGGKLSLASLRGRPVVLNFFASWCEPCKAESKVLLDAARQYGSVENLPPGARIPDLLQAWGEIYNKREPESSPKRLKAIRLDMYRWESGRYADYDKFVESWRKEL